MAICNSVQNIAPSECIGDSLVKINNNFSNLNNDLCLSNTMVTTLSNQIYPTTLFVPVNYNTRSNENPLMAAWAGTGNQSSQSWWSGIQTVTVPNCPANTIGISLHMWANVNSYQNNGQNVYIYREGEEALVRAPSTSTTPQDITGAQRSNLNVNYIKAFIDPSGSAYNLGEYEGDYESTLPIYINTTTKQFKWFWVDTKNGATPAGNPDYSVYFTLFGYYIQVV